MRDNKKTIKSMFLILTVLLVLGVAGFSYAYFSLEIEGTPKDIVMTTGDLRLEYKDETELKLDGAFPGDTVSKVVTVRNVGTKNAKYSLYWGNLINTVENFELHVTLNCKSYINYGETTQAENGTCEDIYRAVPMSDTATTGTIKGNISIDPNVTHEYTVTVTFDSKNYEQNYNKNKSFTGKIGIQEYVAPAVTNCTFDGEMVQGAEYVNGQYTYRYMQEGNAGYSESEWSNINVDGWGVKLTDISSSEPVTSKVCTYINDKPIVSMSYMFESSSAESIDLSSFNTSNVTNMKGMFEEALDVTKLDLSGFNTSNVTNMHRMFSRMNVISLDLSGFDTSSVTDMSDMFNYNSISLLDLTGFDTSSVIDMSGMFDDCDAISIDVSSFDTSNVTTMESMFNDTLVKTLDLSSFNTSNVTTMWGMFGSTTAFAIDGLTNFDTSNVTTMYIMFLGVQTLKLDLSSFNTSNVTDMGGMFEDTVLTELDLSNFDTNNVTNMEDMFRDSSKLKSIYVSNKFATNNIASNTAVFSGAVSLVGGAGTVYDSANVDVTYARIDGGTSSPGYFTLKN